MAKISKRGGFSDRNGIKPENTEIQLKNFDKRTRVQLQNMISRFYGFTYENELYYERPYIQDFLRFVLGTVFSEPIDTRQTYEDDPVFELINNTILNSEYDDVLTLVEAIIQYWDSYLKDTRGMQYYDEYSKRYRGISLYEAANVCFREEYMGYRFADGIIIPVSDAYEVSAIQDALNIKQKVVYEHLSKANRLLADRENPDYENSIKESICAVEALSEIITGIKGKEATLGNMLKKMEEKGVVIHKGLQAAFNALYGYTSDANGIRHAGNIGGPSATFEEAKFMLVACCAFVNYLMALCSD